MRGLRGKACCASLATPDDHLVVVEVRHLVDRLRRHAAHVEPLLAHEGERPRVDRARVDAGAREDELRLARATARSPRPSGCGRRCARPRTARGTSRRRGAWRTRPCTCRSSPCRRCAPGPTRARSGGRWSRSAPPSRAGSVCPRSASTTSALSLPSRASTAGSDRITPRASVGSCRTKASIESCSMGIARLAISTRRSRSGAGGPREARQAQDLAGDALGVVAHALELEVDLDRAVGEPQGQAHRLLPHQELEAQPVDLLLLLVDVLVAQDDRVGLLAVAFLQRRPRSP